MDHNELYEQAADDVKIDRSQLDTEMAEFSSLALHWGQEHTKAYAEYLQSKTELEEVECSVSKKYRDEAALTKVKVTIDSLKEMVVSSKEYQEAKKAFDAAEIKYQALKKIESAIQSKGPMLINIGKLYGLEANTGLQITEEQITNMKFKSQTLRDKFN